MSGFVSFLEEMGGLVFFYRDILGTLIHHRGNRRAIFAQIADICARSLPTVVFSGLFVGAILVIQFNLILSKYDAQTLLGGLNTSATVRQVGPLIISFLLAGKVGAYTTAELGTMRVTEQVEAIQTLGVNPLQYLIVPRFVGIVISSVIMLFIGLLLSIVGALSVAGLVADVNLLQYVSTIPRFTGMWTILGSFFQALVYGTIVGGVACYKGYTARGGARGVGRAVTSAAVYTNFYIVIANYLTSELIRWVTAVGETLLHGGYYS